MSRTQIEGSPCSPQQACLWRVMSRHPSRAYDARVSAVIEGADPAAVRATTERVLERHDILRTGFQQLPGMTAPLQVVGPPAIEWSTGVPGTASGAAVRAAVAPVAHGRVRLVLATSPLRADAESLVRVIAEVASALRGDARDDLETVQYIDYSAWRSDLLASPERADVRGYWDGPLGGNQQGDAAAAPVEAARREAVVLFDAASLVDALAVSTGAGAGAVLLAAWSVTLARSAGMRTAVVGNRFDGRFAEPLREAIGPYAQYLPVRVGWEKGQTFRDLALAVDAGLRHASERQDYADPARTPATGFALLDWASVPGAELHGATIEEVSVDDHDIPLVLSCVRERHAYRATLSADPAEYDAARLARLSQRLEAVVRDAARRPDIVVDRLELLSESERRELVVTLNDTDAAYPSDRTVDQLIEAQAIRTPNRTAVRGSGVAISYGDLDRRANGLASYLARRGAGPGRIVPLVFTRTPDLLVAMLGIMKTGAAYLPLDPSDPPRRVAQAIREVDPPVVVTRSDIAAGWSNGIPLVLMDEEGAAINLESPEPVAVNRSSSDLAYVLFTSGSTGRPNGVRVPHRPLVNYLAWCAAAYDLASGCGALVPTSIAFDLTVTGLLAPLLVGQEVVLVPDGPPVEALAEALLSGDDYTLLKITPSQLRALRPLVAGARLAGRVRVLVLGGEALTGEAIAEFRDHAPATRIVNEYGPTEAAVGCCAHVVGTDDRTGPIPMGRPIANARMYVLDEERSLVPSGADGELYVGGACVTDGYIGRDALTAERFLENPHGPGRLYRTGDRVRYRADGRLEFLGRVDDELKIHGWRIHPLEIEAAMDEHPAVQTSVVAAFDDGAGGRRLVAYYVPRDAAQDVGGGELRRHLLERLPAAVVPGVIVPIASVPMTANGKRDLAALPRPDADGARRAPYAAPRYHEEEVLAAVWASVFGRERIGIDDNYFVLGGDSLRSVQVTALAQKRGVAISVAQIHRHPTIRDLAAVAREGDPLVAAVPPTAPFSLVSAADRALMADEVEDAYPLNLLQEGMIYHREFSPKSAVYHAICSYRIRAPFDRAVMVSVIDQLIARHPLLRTSFDLTSYSRPLQLVHRRFNTPFHFEDLRGQGAAAHDAAVDGWMEQQKTRGFDLDEYPLIRYSVHLLEDGVFQLSYSFHHEIIDGWSDAFMVTELLTHYFSVLNGRPFQAPVSMTTFRDSIALEQKALETDAFREFWKRNLEGAQLMKLPRLISRPKADKGHREIVKIEVPVPEALSDAVKTLAVALAVPVKTVLLAAHMRVMAAFGGVADVLTYTVSNGRPENRDGHGVIGLFVNSLAFRMRVPRGDWKALILETLRTEHELLPYRRYPMAELKRQSGNEPLSETLFFFNHYHVADVLQQWEPAELVGLKVYGESTFPYCINAYLAPVTKRLGMRIEYDSLQYPARLIDAMSERYVDVLTAMVSNPAGRCDVVEAWEDRPAAVAQDGPVAAFEEHGGIHRLCEAAAARVPDAVAVVSDDVHVTHGGLHARAERLAGRLRQRGVGAGTCVGLCLPGSPAMLTAMLAVLKAGGAYVPIDPAYPPERIAYIVQDAPLALVLTQPELESAFRGAPCPVAMLDTILDEPVAGAPDVPGPDLPDELAYVIYTSGSTGRPKGTLITHRALLASTQARLAYYSEPAERFLLLSPFAFDSSAAGLYWTLGSGGTLVLPPGGRAIDLSGLAAAIVDHEITHTLTIPSLYTAFLQQVTALPACALRTLIMAGEGCPQALYDCHRRTLPGVRFFNEYGPTEATVWCTVAEGAPRDIGALVPIGFPIANTRAYVLDAFLQPAPIGVPGELYVAGAGLARGYVRRPDLTAERFVPDPIGAAAGERMYRTGDLVRQFPDGALEFLNRVDAQVKINGFRIELAEIELALERHPKVQRSIVLVQETAPGEKRLVAYVLPAGGERPAAGELVEYARERLPKYMVPAAWVTLERLPLTATGKVDRTALPAAPQGRPDLGTSAVAPRTPTEEIVAGIWRDVLGVATVGVFDDFFELGGESLRAMRIMARVRSVFQIELALDAVMTPGCTVARLADAVETACWASQPQAAAPHAADGQYEVGTI